MSDALSLIATPLGQPGSGRVRYGAAMALYREDGLSEAQLEVYRVASARDGEDPAVLLAERGLPMPALRPVSAAALLEGLAEEAETYLSSLPGPGPAEVRLALAHRQGPPQPPLPRSNAVVEAHLQTALASLGATHPALAAAIAAASPVLEWITYDSYPPDQIGEAFRQGHAFASLVGGEAPFAATDFDFGLFLIAPGILYRDHCHPAPELYAPLTGPHGWRFGPGRPLVLKPAHDPVWNDPMRPHLTKVGAVPFLAFFGWTRDVSEPAQVLPATDWPALEALQL